MCQGITPCLFCTVLPPIPSSSMLGSLFSRKSYRWLFISERWPLGSWVMLDGPTGCPSSLGLISNRQAWMWGADNLSSAQYFFTLMKTLMAPVKSAESRTSVWSVFRAPAKGQHLFLSTAVTALMFWNLSRNECEQTYLRVSFQSLWSPGSYTLLLVSLLQFLVEQ